MKKRITRGLESLAGLFIVCIAFNIFLKPNNIAAGGITGLALVYNKLYNIDISIFVFICNVLLIGLSYLELGKEITNKTVLGAILCPIVLKITEPIGNIIDVKETEIIIQALFGGILSGIGYGLIFKNGFTSGGTDILDQIFTHVYKIPMSKSIIIIDGYIVLLGGIAFGIERMLYAIFALTLISIFSNRAMLGIGSNKTFYIYTYKPELIKEYLLDTIKNDITILNSKGGYSQKSQKILMSVISSNDYYRVKEAILAIDPKAFIVINNSYESVNHNKHIRSIVSAE